MLCDKCGGEVQSGKAFCTHCGAPVPAPGAQGAAPPSPVNPVVPVAAAPKRKRRIWPIVAAAAGALAIAAVVLVLVLVVFKGSTPASVVAGFFEAVEKKDTAAAVNALDPSAFKADSSLEGLFRKEVLGTMPDGVKFNGLAYSTEVDGGKATVRVTGGTATYTEDGKKQTVDMAALENGNRFDMVKADGAWRISPTTFGGVFASSYKDAADKVFEDSLVPKSSELEKEFNSISGVMSSVNAPSSEQMKTQAEQVKSVLGEYKTICAKVKAGYKRILELGGGGVDDYKDYAEAAVGFIDTSIEIYDESLEFIGYVTGVIAERESGGVPDAEEYNQKMNEYTEAIEDLQKKLNGYEQEMQELEEKID